MGQICTWCRSPTWFGPFLAHVVSSRCCAQWLDRREHQIANTQSQRPPSIGEGLRYRPLNPLTIGKSKERGRQVRSTFVFGPTSSSGGRL